MSKKTSLGCKFNGPVCLVSTQDSILDKISKMQALLALKSIPLNQEFYGYRLELDLEPSTEETKEIETVFGCDIDVLRLYTLEYGVHIGTPLKDVPFSYLDWLIAKKEEELKILTAYMNHPQTKRERAQHDADD